MIREDIARSSVFFFRHAFFSGKMCMQCYNAVVK